MNQLSYSPLAGAGAFSPYLGAVLDMAKILSSMHTAKYQYIPALALPQKGQEDTLNLRLNVPPSFRDPKSVIVVALPPVGPAHPPQLHPAEPIQSASSPASGGQAPATGSASNPTSNSTANLIPNYCATRPELTFSAEGGPLVFATAMAHDLTLHIETQAARAGSQTVHPELVEPGVTPLAVPSGDGIDVPVEPNSAVGGFVLQKPLPALPESEVVAELRGKWGFDPWEGPKFRLQSPRDSGWTIPASDRNALITGREDQLHIDGQNTLCVEDVEATLPSNSGQTSAANSAEKPIKLVWKSPKPETLDVTVPLKDAKPGTVTIAIRQYGLAKPGEIPLKAYAEAAAIEHLTLSAGDKVAVLKGKRLDEVNSADLAGITFTPTALNRVQDFDQLELSATGITDTLEPGSDYSAKVTLRDGRTLHVPATVGAPRPQVDLLSKGTQHDESASDAATPPPVRLGSPNDLPLQRKLVFFLRSRVPRTFPRTEKVELAAVDGSFQTTLSLSDGSMMLEDSHTAVVVLDPLARFGASAFGPIQLRAVTAGGISGDWVPLGTLVRLPGFTAGNGSKDLRCPRNPAKPCQLSGTNLFLITEVSATPDMANAVEVPAEFTGDSVSIPNIARSGATGGSGTLYLRLRDDPDTVQTLNLPISLQASGTSQAANPAGSDSAVTTNTPATTATKPDAAPPVAPSDAVIPAPKAENKGDSASTPASTPSPNL